MKKYIKPFIKEINLDPQSLLAGSTESESLNSGDATDPALGKEFDGMSDDWDSNYEEE